MNESIVFIVVTYRGDKKKLDALKNALSGWDVIIVDNTKDNRGYGGGANVGIRKALKAGAQWIVVMNDDMHVSRNAAEEFVRLLYGCAPGIAGPFAGALDERRWTTIYPSQSTDYISGSFIAMHRDVLLSVGLFYAPYFIYYEEVDLCVRAKRAHFPLFHFRLEGISHKGSATFGRGSFLHQYYSARNHLLFAERQAPFQVKLYEFLRLPKTLFEHISRGEWAALAGIRDYVFRRFGQYKGAV